MMYSLRTATPCRYAITSVSYTLFTPSIPSAAQPRPPLLLGPPCMSHPTLHCTADRPNSTLVLPPGIPSRKGIKNRLKKKGGVVDFFLAHDFLPQSTRGHPRLTSASRSNCHSWEATQVPVPRHPPNFALSPHNLLPCNHAGLAPQPPSQADPRLTAAQQPQPLPAAGGRRHRREPQPPRPARPTDRPSRGREGVKRPRANND